jgi:hypothetical protein
MARRILLLALAVCVGGWGQRAAERVTLILSDGQRVNGTIDPSGDPRGIGVSLVVSGGRSQTYNFDEVAEIDFAGGLASANEPGRPRTGQMLVMRNGDVRMGVLLNIVNGSTIVWQEAGARRNIPTRQVARVYLDARNSRSSTRSGGDRRSPSFGQRNGDYVERNAGGRNIQSLPIDVTVPGNQPWTDTGVDVSRGDILRFDDQGGITYINGPNNTANAGGKADRKSDKFPVPSLGVGALIGKIGTGGTPFVVGAGNRPLTIPATGRLWLGVNDDNFSDNAGAFKVTIARGQ